MVKGLRSFGNALLAMVCVVAIASVSRAQDPTKVGPEIYKSIFENDRVRANMITFKPGARIAMHSHPDHLLYWLKGGTLRITNQGEKPTDVTGKDGDVMFLPAVSHMAENIGKTEVKIFQVELKEPAPMKTETEKK